MKEAVLAGMSDPPAASRTLEAAVGEALIRRWPLLLLSVFDASLVSDPAVDFSYVARKNHEKLSLLEEAAQIATQRGVDVTIQVESGDPRRVLADYSTGAGLLVIGRQRRQSLPERVLGGVADWLAAHAECPTLIIPPVREAETGAASDSSYSGKIVAAVDGETSPIAFVESAAWEAKLHGKPLAIVEVRDADEDDRGRSDAEAMLARFHAAAQRIHPDPESSWEIRSGTATEVLVDISHTAEMLVLGSRGHSGLSGLLLGSVSQGVLHGATSAVLISQSVQTDDPEC